jgi:uncharacterized RmlC-like cupin family protein
MIKRGILTDLQKNNLYNSKFYVGGDAKVSDQAIRVIRAKELESATEQTQNSFGKTGVEAPKLWMGRVTCEPGKVSVAHHHGEAETASYILSGHMRICYGEQNEEYMDLGPGDFVYVPPFVPYIERNMSETEPAVYITAQSRGNIQDTANRFSTSEIKVVRASELDPNTNQIENLPMRTGVESQHLWMGRVTGAPGKVSGTHHHGEAETGVYILNGQTRIYYGEHFKEYVQLGPGDLMYVPAYLPHIENNFDDTEPVEFVVARSPRNVVVHLEGGLLSEVADN